MRRRRTSVVLTRVRGLSSECAREVEEAPDKTAADALRRATDRFGVRPPKNNNAFSTSPPATLVDARPPLCAHVGDVQLEPERCREVRTNIARRVRAS